MFVGELTLNRLPGKRKKIKDTLSKKKKASSFGLGELEPQPHRCTSDKATCLHWEGPRGHFGSTRVLSGPLGSSRVHSAPLGSTLFGAWWHGQASANGRSLLFGYYYLLVAYWEESTCDVLLFIIYSYIRTLLIAWCAIFVSMLK